MVTLININYHIMTTILLVCLSSQVSVKNKREQDPSETDYFSPLDESLRLDHLPVHDDVDYFGSPNENYKFPDETELKKIENDVNATPEGEIVLSTVANTVSSYVFDDKETFDSDTQKNLTEAPHVDLQNDFSTYFYDYNDYHNNDAEHVDLLQNFDNKVIEENFPEKNALSDENQLENLKESDVNNANDYYGFDYGYDYETNDLESSNALLKTTESSLNTEVESQFLETDKTTDNIEVEIDGVADIVDENIYNEDNEDLSLNVDEPDQNQLLNSNRIAEDYENEAKIALKPSVWFKQMDVNDRLEEESHLTANCPDLNCEFGFKTDLFGKPICSCFNPCHEKKCGANICKIEKMSESKYIGACYDPSKIERPIHCHLPLATGRCKNYTSRFFFNSFLQRCAHFVYTGCEGNQNNFDTWEKCEMECNTCSLPAARGPCHGNIIRYYYDSLKRECVAFNWGGCKGNENNFQTRKHCEDSCIFRREGALFLHGMPIRVIRKYHLDQSEEIQLDQN